MEGLTLYAGYGFDQHDAFFSGALDLIAVLNTWVSYQSGKYTYTAEYNDYTQDRTGTAVHARHAMAGDGQLPMERKDVVNVSLQQRIRSVRRE